MKKLLILIPLFLLSFTQSSATFLTLESFEEEILKAGNVIVHFNSHSWNVHNQAIFADSIIGLPVYYLDVDDYPEFLKGEGVTSLPTIILYSEGREMWRQEATLRFEIEEIDTNRLEWVKHRLK